MRYVIARLQQNNRDWTYRIYVTDALKVLGGLNVRYYDLFDQKEDKDPDEIIQGVKDSLKKLGDG